MACLQQGAPRPCRGLVRGETLSPALLARARARHALYRGAYGSRLGSTLGSGGVQGGHGDDGQQHRHPVQQRFDGARRGQMQEHPVLVLFDVGRHFEQGQDDGAGLCGGEARVGQGLRAQGMVEHIGGAGEQEACGVGHTRGGGGAVTMEGTRDRFDGVFAMPPRTVELFIDLLGRGLLSRGHDKAGIVPRCHDFGLDNPPPRLLP
jgi:hypothetical protein